MTHVSFSVALVQLMGDESGAGAIQISRGATSNSTCARNGLDCPSAAAAPRPLLSICTKTPISFTCRCAALTTLEARSLAQAMLPAQL